MCKCKKSIQRDFFSTSLLINNNANVDLADSLIDQFAYGFIMCRSLSCVQCHLKANEPIQFQGYRYICQHEHNNIQNDKKNNYYYLLQFIFIIHDEGSEQENCIKGFCETIIECCI